MKHTLQLTFAILFYAAVTFAQDAVTSEINTFLAKTGATSTVDKATSSISFLRFPAERPFKLTGQSPQEKALNFIQQNSGLFSIQSGIDTYLTKESQKDSYGLEHVVLQQYFGGVPVFDGIMKFHFNKSVDLTSMNGNFIRISKLNTTPSISKEDAANAAIKYVTGQQLGSFKAPLEVNRNTLFVFQKGLVQGYQGGTYLVYEVEVRNNADVREFLYIDAHTKELVEQFTGMHDNISRKLYETSVTAANLKWEEVNGTAGAKYAALDKWQKSEVETAGHIYNLMKNTFSFISYNNADAPMITINNNPSINCPNANWNGVTANYCTDIASDDVVAHEWGHAYTEYTSELIYSWQSGALNESYSDIWGETVDQLNGYFDTGESNALRTGCGSSTRWIIGEQASAISASNQRDMWSPNCKNGPGKVSDTFYQCTTADNGGVHTNSSVFNHAYALLVDGGTYNGQTITGLGLVKAAHIFWRAQSNYMSRTTDFAAQADILEASLADLIGINLKGLSTTTTAAGLSGQIITAADAAELAKVIAAVELRGTNNCNFIAILKPVDAICSGASSSNAFFYADFEAGLGAWTVSNVGSTGTWTSRDWVLNTAAPDGRAGKVVYGVDYLGGNCTTNMQNGYISLASPVITIPAGSSGPYNMAFDHYVATETVGYDGGNIRYRINGGAWTLIPASAFTANGYNVTLPTTAQGNTSPLQGQPAFWGTDGGSAKGSWGQSRINLTALGLVSGQTIQFRWDMGTDGCGGLDGWYIDDVRVYTCAIPSVQFAVNATVVNEGEATMVGQAPNECLTYVEKTITVKINKAPSQPATITLNALTGTASEGITLDYSIITPKSFTLQAGTLSKDIIIRIYNDAYVEGNETIILNYSINPGGGNAQAESYNQEHIITIVDDDVTPGIVTADLITANFNAGLPLGWTVVGGGTPPSSWGVVTFATQSLDPTGKPLLFINSYNAGAVALDKVVESAPFNSIGKANIKVSFIQYFSVSPGGFAEQGFVDVWDGSTWHNILTQNEASGTSGSWVTPAIINLSIPTAYANAAMKIRFHYIANFDYWWAVDNVKITGEIPTQIQTAVIANPDEQYLGPNATAYFYDPASKNLMVKIKNLSAHDYGCTKVEVDRAGIDKTVWFSSYHITNKTFKITPTNNNPTGNYEITLYYKASELPTFIPNITSMGKSPGNIGAGNIAATSFAEVQVSAAFNTDYAYTSTFTSGFSGFGLSDAPAVGSLPVTLTKFEGTHTAEGNLLNWTTSAEVNNEYFVIEKTGNGKNFTEIGRIPGNGNSAVANNYKFTDTNFPKGISYYRLKQVDSDGTYAYSRIVSIDALNTRELKFFPNPVQSLLTVDLQDVDMKLVNVKIINSVGQEMMTKEKVKTVNGNFSLNVNSLLTGTYHILISDGQSSRRGTNKKYDYNFSVFKL